MSASEKDVHFAKKKGCEIYIAKRPVKCHARKKKGMAAMKANNDTEQVCAKKIKFHCNDGLLHHPENHIFSHRTIAVPGREGPSICLLHLPSRSPRELCLPSQEKLLSLGVKGLPLVPSSPGKRIRGGIL
jgi:hypothetical protein